MNGEDGLSFLGIGQGDEEDLVETALSQDLRGKEFDDIGRCSNEDEFAFFLHPGEERGKDSGLSSSPCLLALNADARFNLVDPKDRGCDRLCGSKGDL